VDDDAHGRLPWIIVLNKLQVQRIVCDRKGVYMWFSIC